MRSKCLVTIRWLTTLVSQRPDQSISDKYLNYDDINSKIIWWFCPQGSFTHLPNKFDDYDDDASARIQKFAW